MDRSSFGNFIIKALAVIMMLLLSVSFISNSLIDAIKHEDFDERTCF